MKPLDDYEVLVVVALGEKGEGARLLARITQNPGRNWACRRPNVFAQVKSVALGRAEVPE